MKHISYLFLVGSLVLAFSCTPDDPELEKSLRPSDLKYTVTQDPDNDHRVFLSSESVGLIAFWDYGLGITNLPKDTLYIPFGGDFWVKFRGFGSTGSVFDSTKITIAENDPDFFSDPQWNLLTNGAEGKTWVFDPTAPIGYYGKKYIEDPGSQPDGWSYFPGDCPSWSGFECGTVWGEMTFDLNGSYNYTVKQKSLTDDTHTTTKGKFAFDIEEKALSINGAQLLYSKNYDAAYWTQAYVFEVSENALYLGLKAKDGGNYRFKYVPKM